MNENKKHNQTKYTLAKKLVGRVGKSLFISFYYSWDIKGVDKLIKDKIGFAHDDFRRPISTAKRILRDPEICKYVLEIISESKIDKNMRLAAKSIKIGEDFNASYWEKIDDKFIIIKNLAEDYTTVNRDYQTELKDLLTSFNDGGYFGMNNLNHEIYNFIEWRKDEVKECKTYYPGDIAWALMEYLFYGTKPDEIEKAYFNSVFTYNNKLKERYHLHGYNLMVKEASMPSVPSGKYFYETLRCLNIKAHQRGILLKKGVSEVDAAKMILSFVNIGETDENLLIKKIKGEENE